MPTALDLLENLQKVNINEIVKSSLINTTPALLRAQKKQMMAGKTAKGENIKPELRSQEYAKQKKAKYQESPFGIPNLRDTGEFQQNIYLEVDSDSYKLDSTDIKSDKLKAKYGEEIFGLSENFIAEYTEKDLQPEFNRQITEITGLKFE